MYIDNFPKLQLLNESNYGTCRVYETPDVFKLQKKMKGLLLAAMYEHKAEREVVDKVKRYRFNTGTPSIEFPEWYLSDFSAQYKDNKWKIDFNRSRNRNLTITID